MASKLTEYLVLVPDSVKKGLIAVVRATSEEQAWERYALTAAWEDTTFLEYVFTNNVNMSFCERFYRDDDGHFMRNDASIRVNHVYAHECFRKNVREFFGEHKNWADNYLAFFYDTASYEGEAEEGEELVAMDTAELAEDNRKRHPFFPEMLAYMYVKGKFIDDDRRYIIPLSSIRRI